jgi:hypothetical protein
MSTVSRNCERPACRSKHGRGVPDASGRELYRQWGSLARNSAITTASAEMKWTNGWSVAGTFEGEFSPADMLAKASRAISVT